MKLQYYILVAFEFFMRLAPKEVETDVGRRLLDYAEGVTRLLLENLLLVKINKERIIISKLKKRNPIEKGN